jgi:hypothetical protein
MNNSVWKKGLVLGIILLFFGGGVLPSVNGKQATLNLDNETLSRSTARIDIILIVFITDKVKIDTNYYDFTIQLGYVLEFIDGKYMPYPDSTPIIGYPFGFAYHSMRGYFGEHFICAKFFDLYWPYASKLC